MSGDLSLKPTSLREANTLVSELHRHHGRSQGHRWSIAAFDGERFCGAAIVSTPRARKLADGFTAEVARLVTDGTDNACSKLYGACWRAWKAMGGQRMFTYITISEPGTSLRAAGWEFDGLTDPNADWDRPSRRRDSDDLGQKQRWRAHKRNTEQERQP